MRDRGQLPTSYLGTHSNNRAWQLRPTLESGRTKKVQLAFKAGASPKMSATADALTRIVKLPLSLSQNIYRVSKAAKGLKILLFIHYGI